MEEEKDIKSIKEDLLCRMYKRELPEIGELVMIRVNTLNEREQVAYCSLLEYNNIEGMVQYSELSTRRVRSIKDHITIGKTEIMEVLRVDKKNSYVDLTKRLLKPTDINEGQEKYFKAKTVHSILRHMALLKRIKLITLYQQIAWPLYEQYGHAYDAFSAALADGIDTICTDIETSEEIKVELNKLIQQRMKASPVKIVAEIDVTCYGVAGIEAIRPALKKALQFGSEDDPIKVHLLTSPTYKLYINTFDREFGLTEIHKAIAAIKADLIPLEGDVVIIKEPQVVSDNDFISTPTIVDTNVITTPC